MPKRTVPTFTVILSFGDDNAPTLHELQFGEASGALAKLVQAHRRQQQKQTLKPEAIKLQVRAS